MLVGRGGNLCNLLLQAVRLHYSNRLSSLLSGIAKEESAGCGIMNNVKNKCLVCRVSELGGEKCCLCACFELSLRRRASPPAKTCATACQRPPPHPGLRQPTSPPHRPDVQCCIRIQLPAAFVVEPVAQVMRSNAEAAGRSSVTLVAAQVPCGSTASLPNGRRPQRG